MTLLKSTLTGLLLTTGLSVFAQGKFIPFEKMPMTIQNYVKTNFPKHQVVQGEIEKEGLTKEYDLILDNGIKLEFDRKYRIKSIENKEGISENLIPLKIRNYKTQHYNKSKIVKWKTKNNKQSVKLDNNIELEFKPNGDFLRIDD